MHSSFIDTAHLLMGLLRETPNEAADALQAAGITFERVRAVAGETARSSAVNDMTFSRDAKDAIELAFVTAAEFGNSFLACGHLALGITRDPDSKGARILKGLGLDTRAFKAAVKLALESQSDTGVTEFDLRSVRRHYRPGGLLEPTLDRDPTAQLRRWIADATGAAAEPNAMCLSTVSADGRPSSRMVLLRGLDERGLTFYTSYFSRKGYEIEANAWVCALLYWGELERQVRIEGTAERITDEESDAYFATRPRGHQLSAWASEQSETLENREVLEQRQKDYAARFEGANVPRPHSWGGYLIKPERFEFWQGRKDRMHDRLEYTQNAAGWAIRRLQP